MAKLSKTTQSFIPIKDIRDGVVVLTNGSTRMVLIASSVNFALKSEEEQTATLLQYQNFLNSLDFSLQIFIQSKKLNIQPYLDILQKRVAEQENDLIKIQTREYIDFVRNFTESVNIMSKNFFVVIPYSPAVIETKDGVFGFLSKNKNEGSASVQDKRITESKIQLEQRANVVEQGLHACGIRTARLGTEELIELFYKIFNPGEIGKPISKEQEIKT